MLALAADLNFVATDRLPGRRDRARLVAPVIMERPCVSCHNSHPESPKTDWKVGDVRGIQEVSISQPITGNIFAFKYLLGYFALTATVGSLFIALQRRSGRYYQRHEHRA
jgi:adenylate cyclase